MFGSLNILESIVTTNADIIFVTNTRNTKDTFLSKILTFLFLFHSFCLHLLHWNIYEHSLTSHRLLPQSPLWLTFEGKMLAAENLIEELARANGKTSFPPSFRLHLRNLFNSVKGCTMSYVTRHRLLPKFSSPCLRWYFLVHFYLFFTVGIVTEVLSSHVMRLNENKYADHFYRGLIDLGVVIFVYYFSTR